MENFVGRKRPSISLSLFANLSQSFCSDRSSSSLRSPKRFEGDVVGLGIVAAMTDSNNGYDAFLPVKFSVGSSVAPYPPIPIISAAKPAANFKSCLKLAWDVVDELSESYTCVISHCENNMVKKRVYFDDKLNAVVDDCSTCMVVNSAGVFSASPVDAGDSAMEFGASDFLSCCSLCQKQLYGLDIFMYREKAFCSTECREKQIAKEDQKEKCKSEAMKTTDYSVSTCSRSMLFFAGVAAA